MPIYYRYVYLIYRREIEKGTKESAVEQRGYYTFEVCSRGIVLYEGTLSVDIGHESNRLDKFLGQVDSSREVSGAFLQKSTFRECTLQSSKLMEHMLAVSLVLHHDCNVEPSLLKKSNIKNRHKFENKAGTRLQRS